MNFEAYLISKKIDSTAFRLEESTMWSVWNEEFNQMHVNSFTAQKLYLINPIRRKYPAKAESILPPIKVTSIPNPDISNGSPADIKPLSKPAVPRPMVKPKLPVVISDQTEQNAIIKSGDASAPTPKPVSAKPVIARPVIKPKPLPEETEMSPPPPSTNLVNETPPLEVPTEIPRVVKPVIPRPIIRTKPKTE